MIDFMKRRTGILTVILVMFAFSNSGCGAVRSLIFGEPEPTETPTSSVLVVVPTFTATPEGSAPAADQVADQPVAQQPVENAPADTPIPAEESAEEPVEAATPEPTEALPEPTPTDSPPPSARLFVVGDAINIRNGPGTNYGIVGAANNNQEFELVGKSPDGTWWQICCINGQEGWIFGQLARVENADGVAVAQNIPQPPATNTPVPPTPAPQPTDPPAPAAADPCAGIGGDGCKFRLRDGPRFANNGGQELKMQFFFVHGGRGDEPQGSYFVWLEKNGAKLPVGDQVRSLVGTRNEGALGPYNYEYKIGASELGGSVAGNYTMWVLDGNGERDSRNITFSVPEGQGEMWMVLDQS